MKTEKQKSNCLLKSMSLYLIETTNAMVTHSPFIFLLNKHDSFLLASCFLKHTRDEAVSCRASEVVLFFGYVIWNFSDDKTKWFVLTMPVSVCLVQSYVSYNYWI